jgi:hypothetical protein
MRQAENCPSTDRQKQPINRSSLPELKNTILAKFRMVLNITILARELLLRVD